MSVSSRTGSVWPRAAGGTRGRTPGANRDPLASNCARESRIRHAYNKAVLKTLRRQHQTRPVPPQNLDPVQALGPLQARPAPPGRHAPCESHRSSVAQNPEQSSKGSISAIRKAPIYAQSPPPRAPPGCGNQVRAAGAAGSSSVAGECPPRKGAPGVHLISRQPTPGHFDTHVNTRAPPALAPDGEAAAIVGSPIDMCRTPSQTFMRGRNHRWAPRTASWR